MDPGPHLGVIAAGPHLLLTALDPVQLTDGRTHFFPLFLCLLAISRRNAVVVGSMVSAAAIERTRTTDGGAIAAR
jgi:hypothetical protein